MKKPRAEKRNNLHGKKLTASFLKMILSLNPKYRDEMIKYMYGIK